MSGFPEGTVIIRDRRHGLIRQWVMRRDGVQHVRWMTDVFAGDRGMRIAELEGARRALEKAPLLDQ